MLLVLLGLGATQARAEEGSRDLGPEIERAFQESYLSTEFDAAEQALLALIQGCDATCSRSDLARAWMYVGIVRAGGKQDSDGAKAAFEQALALDPKVELDTTVANPETSALFAGAGGKVAPAALAQQKAPPPVAEARPEAALRAEAARAGLVCGPNLSELQTRRSLPVWCQVHEKFWRVTLRYYSFNADGWVSVRMNQVGSRFRVEVPCEATELAGPLQYFVTVTNQEGGLLATLGSLKEPLTIEVRENVEEPPPAFPSELPRERCAERETCPPDFPGCEAGGAPVARGDKNLGMSCAKSLECRAGLYCAGGRCETAPECDIDDDCPGGARCEQGACSMHEVRPAPPSKRHSMFGFHVAMDLGPVAGNDVCSTQDTEFDCVNAQTGREYPAALPDDIAIEPGEPGDPYPGSSVGGFARGSLRVLLSYDHSVFSRLWLGGRLGVAFNGAPSGVDGPASFPLHVELRASYWLFGDDLSRVQPFFFVGGGLAEVDLRKDLVVRDCSTQPTRQRFEDCVNAQGDFKDASADLPEVDVTATRRLGAGFVTGGVGAFIPVFKSMGLLPAVGGLLTFPEVGFVLQPSLGLVVAFQ
jgi:hypothetical protein